VSYAQAQNLHFLMEKWQKQEQKGWKSGKNDINKVGKVAK